MEHIVRSGAGHIMLFHEPSDMEICFNFVFIILAKEMSEENARDMFRYFSPHAMVEEGLAAFLGWEEENVPDDLVPRVFSSEHIPSRLVIQTTDALGGETEHLLTFKEGGGKDIVETFVEHANLLNMGEIPQHGSSFLFGNIGTWNPPPQYLSLVEIKIIGIAEENN
jgi:hypothetical protein